MPGIGDSWGTEEELLHPRGPNGRWIHKAGIAKSMIGGVLDFLRNFRPRSFQSQGQGNQYLHNIGTRDASRHMGRLDLVRLRHDLPHANADLRDGTIDDPSTKRFVDMMDRHAIELPDDLILTRTVGVDAFGFTPETANGTDDNNPGIRGMSGKLVADRGYGLHVVGEPTPGSAGPGRVRMIVAAKKGTKVVVPAGSQDDPTIFTDRDQPLRVTRVVPDGQGGWNMYVTADSHGEHDVPEPIGGPVGPGKPTDREAEIRRMTGMHDKAQKVPDEQAEQADLEARRQKAAEGQQILAQEKAARDQQARQQPATGTPLQTSGPPPRRETIVHPALGGEARPAGGTPTPSPGGEIPETPAAPRRIVDLRRAVRDAGVESPSAGSRRKQWNEAYLGVSSGKKDPIDAVRELDNDIKVLRNGGEPGGGANRGGSEEDRDADIKAFEGLRDVIAREHGIEEAKPTPAKKAAKKAAPSGMTPEQERAVVDRAKQFRGHERNEEETRIVRQADEILARREGTITPVKAPAAKKAAPAAPAKKAAPEVKAPRPRKLIARNLNEGDRVVWEQEGKPPVHGVVVKQGNRKFVQWDGGRKEPIPATGGLGNDVHLEAPGAPAAKKAAPEAPGDDLDKMTKKELLAEAEKRNVTVVKPSWTKDKIKEALRQREEHAAPEAPAPVKKAAKAAVPGAAPGTAAGKITAGRLQPGMRVLVGHSDEGDYWYPTTRKTGQTAITVDRFETISVRNGRRTTNRLILVGHDDNGNEIRVEGDPRFTRGVPPHQTFIVAPEPGAAPAKAAKAIPEPAPKRMTIGESRRLSAMQAIKDNEITGSDGASWQNIARNVESGDWSIAQARKEAKSSARYFREGAGTSRRFGTSGTPESREAAAVRQERLADKYDKLAEDLLISQSVTKTDKFMQGTAPAKKAAKAVAPTSPNPVTVRQDLVSMPADQRFPYLEDQLQPLNLTQSRALAKSLGVRSAGRSEKPEIIARIIQHFEGADDVEANARLADTPDMFERLRRGEGPQGHPGDSGMARLMEPGRDQDHQVKLDRVSAYGDLGTMVDELYANEASPEATAARLRSKAKQQNIPDEDMAPLLRAAEAGDRQKVLDEARALMRREGVEQIGTSGDTVPLDPTTQTNLTRGRLPDGTTHVVVVRPGSRANVDGEDVLIERATVLPATPDEARAAERATTLVPEGSVPGPRAAAPVDNPVRRKDLRESIKDANLPPASPGSGRKSQEEIKGDLVAGRITPEEAVRKFESEIAFTDEDLTEVDAHIREGKASGDLNETELARLERHRAQLQATRESHVKHVEFLREHFKEEAPVHGLAEAKVQDPVSYEFLKDATPDDMREAAKQAGLDPPNGDTPDEMFTDLLKQVARKELERRAAKKATKAAKKAVKKAAPEAPPTVPKERERVDAKLLAEGLDLPADDSILAEVQRGLDGEPVAGTGKNPTPRQIADFVDGHARHLRDSTGIRHGGWSYESMPRDPEAEAERQRLHKLGMDRALALQELAERIRGVRRRPVKKAAPASPEVAKLQDKVDNLEAANIDQVLEQLQGAKDRESGAKALERLTMDELKRLADQAGTKKGRTKQSIRDGLLDRFVGIETPTSVTLEQMIDLPSRQAATDIVAQMDKGELMRLAKEMNLPGASKMNMTELRRSIVEGSTGARLDSIATRGFTGPRPDMPDAPFRSDTRSLSIRARDAGITHPGETFSDVDSAIGDADRRLKGGEDPNAVAKFLRERAARVAKADINEEGRRFKTEKDKESLLSTRKQSAEYLRRVATHVQQEKKAQGQVAPRPGRGSKVRLIGEDVDYQVVDSNENEIQVRPVGENGNLGPAKWIKPSRVEGLAPAKTGRPVKKAAPAKKVGAPSASRTGTSTVTGERSTAPEIKNDWGMLGTGGPVEFHADGAIGQGIQSMGDDRLMDVDGEPLSNVLGKLATRAVRGDISQDQLIEELKRLEQRLPEGSAARRGVDHMIKGLDAPARAPLDLPDWTPEPVTKLMQRLSEVPLSRGGNRLRQGRNGFNEMDTLQDLVKQAEERYPDGTSMAEMRRANWLEDQIRQKLLNHRHESEEGTFQINRSIVDAMRELEALVERLKKTPTPPAPAKKAARLTAIPGGRTGAPKKGTRPKLSVVRNPETGEFSITVVYEGEVS